LNNAGFNRVTEACKVVSDPAQYNRAVSTSPHAGSSEKSSKQIAVNIGAPNCP
jgi:beta-lactam-binding protein with PASTA domain